MPVGRSEVATVPGMGAGLGTTNPLVAAAFHSALRHSGLLAAGLLALLALAWGIQWFGALDQPARRPPEPRARLVLRLAFGALWILDGLLQLQQAMPLALPGQVADPAAASSPGWVRSLVHTGTTIWSRHPIPAATSAVWIQIGIGLLLLAAPRGWWSRAGGLASVGWGLVVWVFGEAFGGIFGPGLSWLFGAPGAVLFYVAAGLLIALPERAWSGPRLGRVVLAAIGTFFVGMAVLQAWPGRGFWQGGRDGAVSSMARSMSVTSQPHPFASAVARFASFDTAHGFAVNLVVVLALAATGIALASGRRRFVTAGLAASVVLCLATWVLVQDLGVFGGVGTDPNSMVPTLALLVSGWLASTRPAAVPSPAAVPAPEGAPRHTAGLLARALAALAAFGVVLVGAVPMASATFNPHADAILTEAVNGSPSLETFPAPRFQLVDQYGRTVTLASLSGRTVALTFLDPVCTSDCPLIAQQLRQADGMLGAADRHRALFVAVVANPLYRGLAYVRAFDRQERLTGLSNWLYLTGPLAALERVWRAYGVQVQTVGAGGMVAHSDQAFVIDGRGDIRASFGSDPGDTAALHASLATLITERMRSVM